ncbi:hypothetical protein GCM10009546_01960 [Actinomadura livida]|uniref:Uncharacterized protein n=1 Tax=Actinomadura livida TaxID=79909 RepID=A0A7W7I7V0_9ACTN|nr:hypothetical protein [Actinomadura catellatispora]GGU02560.1 hypothetical protein GCM10010208_28200 [Actinomadura livida]
MVGVLLERLDDRVAKAVDVGAFGVQDGQQRQGLLAHGLFDQARLLQMRSAKRLLDLGGQVIDTAASARPAQRGGYLRSRQLGRDHRVGSDPQHRSGFAAGQA